MTNNGSVCAVSILRLKALIVLQKHESDQSYYGADSAWWSAVEVNLAIICASLPPLRNLVSKKGIRLRSNQEDDIERNNQGRNNRADLTSSEAIAEEVQSYYARNHLEVVNPWDMVRHIAVEGNARANGPAEEHRNSAATGSTSKGTWFLDA